MPAAAAAAEDLDRLCGHCAIVHNIDHSWSTRWLLHDDRLYTCARSDLLIATSEYNWLVRSHRRRPRETMALLTCGLPSTKRITVQIMLFLAYGLGNSM